MRRAHTTKLLGVSMANSRVSISRGRASEEHFMASCPQNPPPRAGYVYWTGPVPAPLTAWASELLKTVGQFPYGTEWEDSYNGQVIVARLDHHTWSHRNGQLVTGCFAGITLYRPASGTGGTPGGNPNDPNGGVAQFTVTPTDWTAVAVSALAILAIGGGFAAAIHYAGKR